MRISIGAEMTKIIRNRIEIRFHTSACGAASRETTECDDIVAAMCVVHTMRFSTDTHAFIFEQIVISFCAQSFQTDFKRLGGTRENYLRIDFITQNLKTFSLTRSKTRSPSTRQSLLLNASPWFGVYRVIRSLDASRGLSARRGRVFYAGTNTTSLIVILSVVNVMNGSNTNYCVQICTVAVSIGNNVV